MVISSLQRQLIVEAVKVGALRFDDNGFKLKSGRISPYFFNAGLLNSGRAALLIGKLFAEKIIETELPLTPETRLFGTAYKGIPIVALVAASLAERGHPDACFGYNRKEAKEGGEGGTLVGADMKDKEVLIIDDVITSGKATREAIDIITAAGGKPAGMALILDRQERGQNSEKSAVQELSEEFNIRVVSLITLDDLIEAALSEDEDLKIPALAGRIDALTAYRAKYGASTTL